MLRSGPALWPRDQTRASGKAEEGRWAAEGARRKGWSGRVKQIGMLWCATKWEGVVGVGEDMRKGEAGVCRLLETGRYNSRFKSTGRNGVRVLGLRHHYVW